MISNIFKFVLILGLMLLISCGNDTTSPENKKVEEEVEKEEFFEDIKDFDYDNEELTTSYISYIQYGKNEGNRYLVDKEPTIKNKENELTFNMGGLTNNSDIFTLMIITKDKSKNAEVYYGHSELINNSHYLGATNVKLFRNDRNVISGVFSGAAENLSTGEKIVYIDVNFYINKRMLIVE